MSISTGARPRAFTVFKFSNAGLWVQIPFRSSIYLCFSVRDEDMHMFVLQWPNPNPKSYKMPSRFTVSEISSELKQLTWLNVQKLKITRGIW